MIIAAVMEVMSNPVYDPPATQVSYAQCVATRESNSRPKAVSPSGKYRGKYQFSPGLARGATWHILDWLATWHPDPKGYAARLRVMPMNKWPENIQDAAFFETLNHDGMWSGRKHWEFGPAC